MPVPGKVSSVIVVGGDTSVDLSWSAPSGGGTATDYDVQHRSDAMGRTSYGNWTDYTHEGTLLDTTVTGLTNGSNYQFRVRGGNDTGEGEWSDASPSGGVVPAIPVPGKVPVGAATAGDTTVDLSWSAPSGIVTDYDIQYRFVSQLGVGIWSGYTHIGTSRTSTVTGLANSVVYQFRVRAGNSTGKGEWSEAFPRNGSIPQIPLPGKVSRGVATVGDTTIDISWSAGLGL